MHGIAEAAAVSAAEHLAARFLGLHNQISRAADIFQDFRRPDQPVKTFRSFLKVKTNHVKRIHRHLKLLPIQFAQL
jgi:hypothetical protein